MLIVETDPNYFPTELLNTLEISGLFPHKLNLKVGMGLKFMGLLSCIEGSRLVLVVLLLFVVVLLEHLLMSFFFLVFLAYSLFVEFVED